MIDRQQENVKFYKAELIYSCGIRLNGCGKNKMGGEIGEKIFQVDKVVQKNLLALS